MKSITDMTWKDAAVVEVRSLIARLEENAGRADGNKVQVENSLTRQAVRLAEIIDKIEEMPLKRKRKPRNT